MPHNLTDKELLNRAQDSDNPLTRELASRIEQQQSDWDDERKGLIAWAVGCVQDHAGEDRHADVINSLQKILKANKPTMINVIVGVIETLRDMDQTACNSIEAMKSGDAF